MKNRMTMILCSLVLALALCGCSGLFSKEYVAVEEYPAPVVPQSNTLEGKLIVQTYTGLRQAVRGIVYNGSGEGSIVLDQNYDGNPVNDLASACWDLRTNDALCAYCVDNISYDISQIVSYYEATIHVTYGDVKYEISEIEHLYYFSGLESGVLEMLEGGLPKLVAVCENSTQSAENAEELVKNQYTLHPYVCPGKPDVTVNIYSGSGNQKLYEINLMYHASRAQLDTTKAAVLDFELIPEEELETMTPARAAFTICEYLNENCEYSGSAGNSAYAALIEKQADSEGIALAYSELCRRAGIECSVVYGQYQWTDHCWNVIRLGDSYYHVDASADADTGPGGTFLWNDEEMWISYRWDTTKVPSCNGDLKLSEIDNA